MRRECFAPCSCRCRISLRMVITISTESGRRICLRHCLAAQGYRHETKDCHYSLLERHDTMFRAMISISSIFPTLPGVQAPDENLITAAVTPCRSLGQTRGGTNYQRYAASNC